MADTALSALTAASTLDGTELLYAVQGGADRKATVAQVKTWASNAPTLVTPVLGVATATSIALGGATLGGNALAVTGTVLFNNAFSLGAAFTYGGVTLNNAVTGTGNMVLSAAPTFSGTAIFASLSATGTSTILSATSIPAGGTSGSGFKFSSTSNYGLFFGSGAPSLSAARGSLYLRSDGSPYYNNDGSTGWTSMAGGSGDLISTNNLSDVANTATAFGNIKQAATDTATGVVELATTAEAETGTDTVRAVTPAGLKAAIVGKQTMWIPAISMIVATTNGPSTGAVEQTTNKNMTKTLDFDTTTSEIVQFFVAFPKSWDLGTVTFIPHWTAASGSGTVIWALSGVAISNDDALDVAFGTAQSSSDTLITAYDNHVGPESSAITIAGTPAAQDLVNFKLVRDVADTLGVDAKLIGIQLIYTTNAMTDD